MIPITPAPDGSFEVSGVPPGTYRLMARSRVPRGGGETHDASVREWAFSSVTVDAARGADLRLQLEAGADVSGRMVLDDAPAIDFTGAAVRLSRIGTAVQVSGVDSFDAIADETGAFRVPAIPAGRYRIAVAPPTERRREIAVQDVLTAAGENVLDTPLEIRAAGPHRLTVRFTGRVTSLSGRFLERDGRPVSGCLMVVFPENRALWLEQSRRLGVSETAPDGGYTFVGIPAGDYLLAAACGVDAGELLFNEVLERLAPTAARVTLAEGEQRTFDVTVQSGAVDDAP